MMNLIMKLKSDFDNEFKKSDNSNNKSDNA